MVRWVRLKNQKAGSVHIVKDDVGNPYYFFGDEKGIGMPDDLADKLMKTGAYEECKSKWHDEQKVRIEGGIVKSVMDKLPSTVKKLVTKQMKKNKKK